MIMKRVFLLHVTSYHLEWDKFEIKTNGLRIFLKLRNDLGQVQLYPYSNLIMYIIDFKR